VYFQVLADWLSLAGFVGGSWIEDLAMRLDVGYGFRIVRRIRLCRRATGATDNAKGVFASVSCRRFFLRRGTIY
jgi:hypothetical protein